MDLRKLAGRLRRDFGPPFLAEGIVEVKVLDRDTGPHLMLRIGPRDVVFNAEGEVTDAGTSLCSRLVLEQREPPAESSLGMAEGQIRGGPAVAGTALPDSAG